MISLFRYDDVTVYLQDVINSNKAIRGYSTKLAVAAGCQVSYLSQFLRGKNQLTLDHGAGITDFLGHSAIESDYFLNLILLSRAGTKSLRQKLQKKLQTLKTQQETVTGQIENSGAKQMSTHRYYSSWLYAAIYIAIAAPNFQTVPNLAKRFHTSESKVLNILVALEEMGLISKTEGTWSLTNNLLHLPKDSEMTAINHFNWRQRALFDIDADHDDSLHYSSVFAIAEKDAITLKDLVLNFLTETRMKIQESPSEEVFCFNLDLFKV